MSDRTPTPASSTGAHSDGPRAKSANGDGGIRQRRLADGTLVYDVVWSYRDRDGKPCRGWKRGFTTKKDAAAFRRSVTRAVDAGTYLKPAKLTLATYLADWLDGLRLKPQTIAGYRRNVRLHINAHPLAQLALGSVTATVLNKHYRHLEQHGSPSGNGPLSLTTVREVHNMLSGAFRAAVKAGLLATNPCASADPPSQREAKARRPTFRTWTPEQARAFLDVTRDHPLHPLWHLALHTGLRRGELLGLHWADVDLDRRRVSVRYSVGEDRTDEEQADGTVISRRRTFLGPTKTHRAHQISIDPSTVAMLRAHHTTIAAARLRHGEAWEDQDLVFPQLERRYADGAPPGGLLRPENVSRAFRECTDYAAAVADVPKIRFHDLRHTWATLALQNDVHPKVVQEHLNHANVLVTLDIYSHVTEGMDDQAVGTVAAALAQA